MFTEENYQEPEDLFHKSKKFFDEEILEEETLKEEKRNGPTFYFAILLLLIIASPLFFLLFNFFLSFRSLGEIQKAMATFDSPTLEEKSDSLKLSLDRNLKMIEISGPIFQMIGQEKFFEKTRDLLIFGKNLAESSYQISQATENSEAIFKKVLGGEEVILEENLDSINLSLGEAFEKTSIAQGLLNQFSGNEPLVGPYLVKLKEILPHVRQSILTAQEATHFLPSLLGEKGRKTYLVLFQNNMEIRPSGGFIGSYGLLTFENGKLLDFEIHDVYFADGQLKGHVEPPSVLKEFLGSSGWYLRDSNWDPDFPTSAERASWFLEKETGRKVDGVIGLNLFVVQRILEKTGEIQLPDYNEKINEKNFFEKAEYYSEAGFFPGSTGKQDFLGQVGRVLFEKIKNAQSNTWAQMTGSLLASLEEKNLMISLEDPDSAAFLSRLNWDGALKRARCKEKKDRCLEDYLMIVEGNVGVNKSNYFLKRSLDQIIKIEENIVSETLILNYENQSPEDVFPAGKYKSYVRLYVPEGSTADKIIIKNPDKSEEIKEIRLDLGSEHNRTFFGFLIEVPVGEKRKVEVNWHFSPSSNWEEYLLLVQKQSGMKEEPYNLSLSYPKNMTLLEFPPSALTGEGRIVYNTSIVSDFFVRVNFLRK